MIHSSGVGGKELNSLTKRVVKLLDKEIDEIWFLCGWRTRNPCRGFKALSEEDLRGIRSEPLAAKKKLNELLSIFPIVRFKRKLISAESGVHFER